MPRVLLLPLWKIAPCAGLGFSAPRTIGLPPAGISQDLSSAPAPGNQLVPERTQTRTGATEGRAPAAAAAAKWTADVPEMVRAMAAGSTAGGTRKNRTDWRL
jgi:hypothetical protein